MVETIKTYTLPFPGGRNQAWAVPGTEKLEELPTLREHVCHFKGNTLVEMTPDIFPGSPVFKRKYLLTDKAPSMKVTRYVSDHVQKW